MNIERREPKRVRTDRKRGIEPINRKYKEGYLK